MAKTYAVTGGTGFLGAAILDQLLDGGHRVRALARDPGRLKIRHHALSPVAGALEDEAALRILVEGADVLIHCAGLTHARRDAEFHKVNAVGAGRIAALAHATGARTVLISSMAARRPDVSPYAASKKAGEDFVRDASHGEWAALRAPAIYGPGDDATLPFFKLVKSGFALEPAQDPAPRASILYVGDVAAAAIAAADSAPPGVYEIGDERAEGHSWRDIGEALGEALGVRPTRIRAARPVLEAYAALAAGGARLFGGAPMVTPGKIREFFHPDWVARDNLLSETISWRPNTPLKEGFAKTVRWYEEKGRL